MLYSEMYYIIVIPRYINKISKHFSRLDAVIK